MDTAQFATRLAVSLGYYIIAPYTLVIRVNRPLSRCLSHA